MSLWSEFLTNDHRLIHKWTHYFPVYERYFERFRNKTVTIIEIGVSKGGSLQLWKRYFGPFATIVGVDINQGCRRFEEPQISVRIGDQSDPAFLQKLIDEFGTPDIVIDDGSHQMAHVCASFDYLYPLLDRNGVYVVEDLYTAYWEDHGGGLKRPGTFIERCKDMIDDLHGDNPRAKMKPSIFTKTTHGMHIHDGIVVFERGQMAKRLAPRIGRDPDAVPAEQVVKAT